ncbi:MAG: DUF523 domain-containing protein [Firmicutes bacterium]|nr:DUF523 domain-containing protein [Bacillota bacterium]
MPPVLVSACLLGNPCRYNGTGYDLPVLVDSLREFTVIPVCPEVLGELPVPRPPAELVGGDGRDLWQGKAVVQTEDGADLTAEFKAGARRTLELGKKYGAKMAILKEHSPSCGSLRIHDGSFGGRLVPGMGVTSALLKSNGITVFSEKNWLKARGKGMCPANIDG